MVAQACGNWYRIVLHERGRIPNLIYLDATESSIRNSWAIGLLEALQRDSRRRHGWWTILDDDSSEPVGLDLSTGI